MEVENALKIAEAVGCFFRFDETMKSYVIYVGQSSASIKADDLKKLDERKFKTFLLGFMSQEAEEWKRSGGPTRH
jgi:hypothetical protein